MPATMTGDSNTLVFALATLGKATEIEMIIMAKVSKKGDIMLRHRFEKNN